MRKIAVGLVFLRVLYWTAYGLVVLLAVYGVVDLVRVYWSE